MDQLPFEIKCMIGRHIRDDSIANLPPLALVNKEWKQVASSLLYEHIIIPVLQGDLWHKTLCQTEGVLAHIKRLTIVNTRYNLTSKRPYRPPALPRPYRIVRNALQAEDLGDLDIPWLGAYSTNHPSSSALIDLIAKIPRLRDIDLFISNNGPVELHEAIREHHPSCRVSIYFKTAPHERYPCVNFSVLSPQLHTVYITLYEYRGGRSLKKHPDTALKNVLCCAPNVRKLALEICSRDRGPLQGFDKTLPIEAIAGLEPQRANLDELTWPMKTPMVAAQFLRWNQLVNYSRLKSWQVGWIDDTQLLREIASLSPFQDLRRLTLAIFPPDHDDVSFYAAAEAMFESLPPLQYLCLLGNYRPTLLTTALRKHGPTLLELKLNASPQNPNLRPSRFQARGRFSTGPICSVEDIESLAAQCSSLKTLSITVQRSRGLEAPVYTALGRFPLLSTLDLYLNCPPLVELNGTDPITPFPPRDLTEFEKESSHTNSQVPNWYIRDTMINTAIDKDLATTIFRHIRAHQAGDRCLTTLKIRPLYSTQAGTEESLTNVFYRTLAKNLEPYWTLTVQRDVSASPEDLRYMKSREEQATFIAMSLRDVEENMIYKSIWPPVEGVSDQDDKEDWPQGWRSWPLQEI